MSEERWETLAQLNDLFTTDVPLLCERIAAQIADGADTIEDSQRLAKAAECLILATLFGCVSPPEDRNDIFAMIEQIIRNLEPEAMVLLMSAVLKCAAVTESALQDLESARAPFWRRWWGA